MKKGVKYISDVSGTQLSGVAILFVLEDRMSDNFVLVYIYRKCYEPALKSQTQKNNRRRENFARRE